MENTEVKTWKKNFKAIWGVLPPPKCQKWMADCFEMLGEKGVAQAALPIAQEVLDELTDFAEDYQGMSFEEYFEDCWTADQEEDEEYDPEYDEDDDFSPKDLDCADIDDDSEDDDYVTFMQMRDWVESVYGPLLSMVMCGHRQWLVRYQDSSKTVHEIEFDQDELETEVRLFLESEEAVEPMSKKSTPKNPPKKPDANGSLTYKHTGSDKYGTYEEYESQSQSRFRYYKDGGVSETIPYKSGGDYTRWVQYGKDKTAADKVTKNGSSSSYNYTGSGYGYGTSQYTANAERDKMRKLPYRPSHFEFPQFAWERTIIVGDLHGCADELLALLDLVKFKPGKDRLISVGDIVDRGPKIHECFEILRAYNAWLCLGNHEEPFLKWYMFETHEDYKDKWSGKNNPIDLTIRADQKATLEALTKEDWHSMFQMQLFFRLREYKHNPLVVHAGLFPGKGKRPEDMDPFGIIRMVSLNSQNETLPFSSTYGESWWDKYEENPGRYHVIYGHSTAKEVRNMGHSTGLDTGACYGGSLSALVLPDWKFASVSAATQHYVGSKEEISGGQGFQIGKTKEDLAKTFPAGQNGSSVKSASSKIVVA